MERELAFRRRREGKGRRGDETSDQDGGDLDLGIKLIAAYRDGLVAAHAATSAREF